MRQLVFILLIVMGVMADLYWVSPTGEATWANAKSATALSGAACCARATMNTGLLAGDTAYLRGGTYTLSLAAEQDAIDPDSSGTDLDNRITILNYNDEDVIFETGRFAINLNCDATRNGTTKKRQYIKVSGSAGHLITFNQFDKTLWILKTSNNEIAYCKFYDRIPSNPTGLTPQGCYIYIGAHHNWIHHNEFVQWGSCQPYGTDEGGPFQMGINDACDSGTSHNLVENNYMAYGGHHVAWLGGSYNVYRNNYFQNAPWCSSGTFATRILVQNGWADGYTGDNIDGIHNLNEGNSVAYGGPKNKNEVGGNIIMVMGSHNIWRYNVCARSYCSTFWVHCYNDYGEVARYNHVYNNTVWHGGYGYYQDYYDPRHTAPTGNWARSFHHPVNIEDDTTVSKNTFKNNLFYDNNVAGDYSLIISGGAKADSSFTVEGTDYYTVDAAPITRQNLVNNWTDHMGNPKFVDISAAAVPAIDPTTLWNFNLQASSDAIDNGTYLATADGAGDNSKTLVLNTEEKDPYPASALFYDVGGIASEWPTANVNNDWIAIGTVTDTIQIGSINYATNTITLQTAKTWANGASVWLYKKSDGVVVLNGLPDMGAFEFNSEDAPKKRVWKMTLTR